MELDLIRVKEWMVNAIKRAASQDQPAMSFKDVNDAFDILDDLDKAIASGDFEYVGIYVPENANVRISQQRFNEIQKLLDAGKKIMAIKMLREISGIGLKDAKQGVEALGNWDLTKFEQRTYEQHR